MDVSKQLRHPPENVVIIEVIQSFYYSILKKFMKADAVVLVLEATPSSDSMMGELSLET